MSGGLLGGVLVFWFALGNFLDFIEEAAVTGRVVEGGVEGLDGNGVIGI
jgi:hypothetical protein